MDIKILGTGCTKCNKLFEAVQKANEELGNIADISKVEDISKIIGYGVMSTPAMVVNNKVVFAGRVPSVEEIKKIINQHKV